MGAEMTADFPPPRPPRDPLSEVALREQIVRPGGLWREVSVAARTGSTNADLVARAGRGAPEGLVLAAEEAKFIEVFVRRGIAPDAGAVSSSGASLDGDDKDKDKTSGPALTIEQARDALERTAGLARGQDGGAR